MANSAKRDRAKANVAERQRKALELRKAGATYEQIASQLSYADRSGAAAAVKAGIKAIIAEPAQEVLALELQRLDAMLLGLWTKAKSGDVAAVDRALRIMERRANFLGIDAPKATVAMTTDAPNDVRQQLLDRIASLNPGDEPDEAEEVRREPAG